MKRNAILFFILFPILSYCQDVIQISDINTSRCSPEAIYRIIYNSKMYFTANDGIHGDELWMMDESHSPRLISDILPGQGSSQISGLFIYANKLFFPAYKDDGFSIWVYDETSPPKKVSEYYNVNLSGQISDAREYMGKLYYRKWIPEKGSYETWVFDEKTTGKVTDIYKGYTGTDLNLFAIFRNKLYFTTKNSGIWAYDGKDSVYRVADCDAQFGPVKNDMEIGKYLFFISQYQLWRFDGINKPQPVWIPDVFYNNVKCNNSIYFTYNSGNYYSGTLWKFDTINAPVQISKQVRNIKNLTVLNNKLYYTGEQEHELWMYNGNDWPRLIGTFDKKIQVSQVLNNKLFFSIEDDGTYYVNQNDSIIKQLDCSLPSTPGVTYNNEIYFFTSWQGSDLTYFNGIDCPKEIIMNTCNKGSDPNRLFVFKEQLYFSAYNNQKTSQYHYDGTHFPEDLAISVDQGHQINDLYYYSLMRNGKTTLYTFDGNHVDSVSGISNSFSQIRNFNNLIYASDDNQLKIIQGKKAIEVPSVIELRLSSSVQNMFVFNGRLIFTASDSNNINRLWSFDGENKPVAESRVKLPSGFTIFKNNLYFFDSTALWIYGGTGPAYTVVQISQHEIFFQSGQTKVVGEKLYFSLSDGIHGSELWSLEEGHLPVIHDIFTGSGSSSPGYLTEFNSELYFTASDSLHGLELWHCNDTLSPEMIADIYEGYIGSNITGLHVFRNQLLFSASDKEHGQELWSIDSTTKPGMIKDIVPGSSGSYPYNFITFRNRVCFSAEDIRYGRELYEYCPDCSYQVFKSCKPLISQTGNYYTESGIFTDTISKKPGCYSLITTLYTRLPMRSAVSATSCNQYTSPSGKYAWNISGEYTDTIPSMEGCDSVITVHLIIKKSTYSSVDTAVCDRYRSPSGKIIESGGIYTDTLVNAVGCDSIITINLKVNHSSRTDLELSACDSVILDLTGVNYKWTSSGTFSDTIPASCGCDSIITANIHIDHVDPGVIIDRNVLVSLDRDAAYQWIDCDNGNTPVPGETYLAFTPDHSGRYAVIITQGACVDTSLAYSVIITGNGEVNNGNIQMYPNPTNGKVTIDLGKEYGEATITILNSTGIVIQERQMRNARKQEIILNEEGIYLVKVSVGDEQVILKVINQ